MSDPLGELRAAILSAAESVRQDGVRDLQPTLERPPSPDLGDYSTNVAMLLAPASGEPPRRVADRLGPELERILGPVADRVEVAGPGFLNLFLGDRWHREGVARLLEAEEGFGAGSAAASEGILVEFVSANPTGPLTAASGRHAAYGDALARVLEFAGHRVQREYYVNDVGGQVRHFAESIAARMRGQEPSDQGYQGEYVRELGEELAGAGLDPADVDELGRRGTEIMRTRIQVTLERFRVRFDTWFSERSLHEGGSVEAAIEALRQRGEVYERDGALWLRTSTHGDDKDRVLIRADGEPTYFAGDIAYHRDKLERGAERLVDVLGPDHHGYVPRMRAALEALGMDPARFEAPLMQMVHVIEPHGRARMSKRRGEFVTLDELVDDIGVDAARLFMLQRSNDTTLDLDLELARRQSQDNPVYYVQYAHARIASILRKALDEETVSAAAGGAVDEAALVSAASDEAALAAPSEPAERALVRRLLEFSAETASAAERRAPHRLSAYATATAADFHAFYRDCRVVGAEAGLEQARLGICLAAKRVIATTLELLGVSAPDRM